MSNKDFQKLNSIDQSLRELFPIKPTASTKVQLKIEKICGFELFNTRPYHNHETYSDGYRAIINDDIICESEDLDDLVSTLYKYKCKKCQNFHSPRKECGEIK